MKIGDKVKCISPTTTGPMLGPNQKRILTVTQIQGSNSTFRTKEYPGSYFYQFEFKVIPQSKEEIALELKELTERFERESKDLQNRILYMTETGLTEYDETEFKVWSVLSELKTGADQLTTAKAIAKIVSS